MIHLISTSRHRRSSSAPPRIIVLHPLHSIFAPLTILLLLTSSSIPTLYYCSAFSATSNKVILLRGNPQSIIVSRRTSPFLFHPYSNDHSKVATKTKLLLSLSSQIPLKQRQSYQLQKSHYVTTRFRHVRPHQNSNTHNIPRLIQPFLLTTSVSSNDESNKSSQGILQYIVRKVQMAGKKFQARPMTYLIIPCIAALVGWFTNWLAVQMIFYPINFWGIPIWRRSEIPLGLIGWQGIVPCKTQPMTIAIVDMVTTQLLTVSEAFSRIDPSIAATILAPELPKIMNDIVHEMIEFQWITKLPKALNTITQPIVHQMNLQFLQQLVKGMQMHANKIFNIQNCVVNQMMLDRSKLGELFQSVATAELQFLTNSGLWFGFLLGIIQLIIALFWDNPWSLSIGGLVVGMATNWLALKWIFKPIDPYRIGPFLLQGQFLRRQKEVAAIFSNFFATNILNSKEMWNSVLTDPTTRPEFANLLTHHIKASVSKVSRFIPFYTASSSIISTVSAKVLDKLPNHIPVLFPYMDHALGLETTLRVKMEQMTSLKFERVLHPIFEEDELTLIIAGAALGFLAGLIQQGLETGRIKIPPFGSMVRKWFNNLRSKKTPPTTEK